MTLHLAREANIERLVYFSVLQGDVFATVPHFAAKHAAELMIDVAEVAASAVLERERCPEPLPHHIINLVGPEALTGEIIAKTWSDLLGRPVRYAGDDTAPFEQNMRGFRPSWAALDLRLMPDRFQTDGMEANAADIRHMTDLLGQPPRSYADFARARLDHWQAGMQPDQQ